MNEQEFEKLLDNLDSETKIFPWKLTEAQAIRLSEIIATNKTITLLNLSCNQIGDTSTQYLAKALGTNKTITSIDLSRNRIGNLGAAHLAQVLQSNKTITSLNLSHNQIGNLGAWHLSIMLKSNNTIASLQLVSNQIGDEGAEHLAKALKSNNTITSFNLCTNKITEKLITHFADAVTENPNLRVDVGKRTVSILNTINKHAAEKALKDLIKLKGRKQAPTKEEYAEMYSKLCRRFGLVKEIVKREQKKYEKITLQDLQEIYEKGKEIAIQTIISAHELENNGLRDPIKTIFKQMLTDRDIAEAFVGDEIKTIMNERDALYSSKSYTEKSKELRDALFSTTNDLIELQNIYRNKGMQSRLISLEREIAAGGVYAAHTLIKYINSANRYVRGALVRTFARIDEKYMSLLDKFAVASDREVDIKTIKEQIHEQRNGKVMYSDISQLREIEKVQIAVKKRRFM